MFMFEKSNYVFYDGEQCLGGGIIESVWSFTTKAQKHKVKKSK